MAVLSDNERFDAWAELMRDMSRAGEPCSLSKADLRAVLDALDKEASDSQIKESGDARLKDAMPQLAKDGLSEQGLDMLSSRIIRARVARDEREEV
jgi:hypothetical protein